MSRTRLTNILRVLLLSMSVVVLTAAADKPYRPTSNPLKHIRTIQLLSDDFQTPDSRWKEIFLDGKTGGSWSVAGRKCTIESRDRATFGIYHSTPVGGHFCAEAEFTEDAGVGFALIREKNGVPDPDNFTMLCVQPDSAGTVEVFLRDRQNGKDNVFDNTGTWLEWKNRARRNVRNVDGYRHVLDGKHYSIPFDRTDKKLRIFRDNAAGFLHFYYAVRKTIRGKEASDWMELFPSKEWGGPGGRYFVALVALPDKKAVFDAVRAVIKPLADIIDVSTGFKASRREYNWSGFFGEAVVVSFGDAFPYRNRDFKFVFWSEANYIPVWHLNNQLLFTYEFAETWGGGVAGCNEPMSDRLRRWTRVDILEDNPVRKVIRWHYVLCNPDYQVPDDARGEQVPEVDEYYTFYPDGSGTRRTVYMPKLDTDFRAPNEIAEMIAISGSLSACKDFFDSPALTVLNLEGDLVNCHPGPKFGFFDSPFVDWKQQIVVNHFKDLPDVFCAFSDDEAIPGTFSGYKIRYENEWQNINGRSGHWPVNKTPYTSANGNTALWTEQVKHACLVSIDIQEGVSWEDHFQISPEGRKFREWTVLIGLNDRGDLNSLLQKTQSWLFRGRVNMLGGSGRFIRVDYRDKSFLLEKNPSSTSCSFEIDPDEKSPCVLNPVFRIQGWGSKPIGSVGLNGEKLSGNRWLYHFQENGDVLLWLNATILSKASIIVK